LCLRKKKNHIGSRMPLPGYHFAAAQPDLPQRYPAEGSLGKIPNILFNDGETLTPRLQ
jgi:hypothetical protein